MIDATNLVVFAGLLSAAGWFIPAAEARSLEIIRTRGAIEQCAHPNALPFSSRKGDPQGFQIELGEAIAKQLGVALEPVWIIGGHQVRRAGCDIVTDAIAQPEIQDESGLKVSKPYYRTGIVLAVRPDSPIVSTATIERTEKIGVMGSSVASMVFNKRGLRTSAFAFEDEMLAAVADREIDGAVISRAAAGYFNVTHPGQALRIVDIDDLAPEFSWNVAVGMSKPDDQLRAAINSALDQLGADGTIQRIYAKYGIQVQPPK
jgi:polar amino acid transport system substrate-binding protein